MREPEARVWAEALNTLPNVVATVGTFFFVPGSLWAAIDLTLPGKPVQHLYHTEVAFSTYMILKYGGTDNNGR